MAENRLDEKDIANLIAKIIDTELIELAKVLDNEKLGWLLKASSEIARAYASGDAPEERARAYLDKLNG